MNPCLNQWFSEQVSLFLPLPLTLQLTQSSFPTRCPHLPLLVFQPSLTSLLLDQVTIFSFSSFLTSASPPSPDCPSHFKNVASLSLHDITHCRFFFLLFQSLSGSPSLPVHSAGSFSTWSLNTSVQAHSLPMWLPWSPISVSFRSHILIFHPRPLFWSSHSCNQWFKRAWLSLSKTEIDSCYHPVHSCPLLFSLPLQLHLLSSLGWKADCLLGHLPLPCSHRQSTAKCLLTILPPKCKW